jgi:hypothetical protein
VIVFSFPFFQFSRRSITFYSMGKPEINIDILRTIMCCVLCCFEGFPRDALHFFSFLFFLFYHFLLLKLQKSKLKRLETFSRQQNAFPGVQVIASSRLPSPFTFSPQSESVSEFLEKEISFFFRSHSFCFEKLKIKTN